MLKPNKIFNFAPSDYAREFAANGFVVVENGVSDRFLNYAVEQIGEWVKAGDISTSNRHLKQEFLFSFPDDRNILSELVETIGQLTGLLADDLIISERHLKIYREDAQQNPLPHKDRKGTQLAVGIPIDVSIESRLILYPFHELDENSYDSYDDFLASLPEDKRPEKALRDITPLSIDTKRGDLIVFLGSRIWHERTNAAGSKLLYLKMNALGLDPLGENLPELPMRAQRIEAGARRRQLVT